LRAIEVGADLMIKATNVDGVYDSDPRKNPDARRYDHLTYDEAIGRQLGVMDATALVLCRDNNMPLIVADINVHGLLPRLVAGERVGTLVTRVNQALENQA
jgi:uridylate kinase